MRYYVTGGLGVIGSCFAKSMLNLGHDVTIVDSAEEQRNLWMAHQLEKEYGNKVTIQIKRIEHANLSDACDHDFILHAAAHTGIPHSTQDPTDDWISNVDTTRQLLETLRKCKTKIPPPTVVLSSVKPYQVKHLQHKIQGKRFIWRDELRGIDESWPIEPDEPYAASKLSQSAICMSYARTYNLPVTILRCSNLYGPAPCHGPRHGWLTWLCISAILNREIEIQGTGLQVRDMLYSDDITSAIIAAGEHIIQTSGNVYNVGGGHKNSISVLEAIDIISETIDVKTTRKRSRRNEDLIFITDHTKFSSVTGWHPLVNVKTGIRNILKYADNKRDDLRDIYNGI